MRPSRFRVVRPLVLSLVILSCATENALGPTVSSDRGRSGVDTPAPTPAKIVISQVYGAGGNSGAAYDHDYIELFNAGGTAQSLAGWSVQYASATGTGSFGGTVSQITALPSVSIEPGKYYLIAEAGGANGKAVPADLAVSTNPIAMAAGAGKVALVRASTSLGCNGGSSVCNSTALALIVDLIGYGTGTSGANFSETSPAPTLNATSAAIRNDHGCADTDNNAADFKAATPDPRNQLEVANPCVPVVPAGPVASVEISPTDATVRKGSTLQLSAVGKDLDDHVSPTTFTWESSDATIASVTPTGVVTGVNEGTVDITATAANGVADTTTVSVAQAGSVGSVSISINTPRQVPVGFTKPAFPTVKDADNRDVTAATTLTWSSSDDKIAVVDSRGYITGVSAGKVVIKAAASNGVFGTSSFTVEPADAATSAKYGDAVEFGQPSEGRGPNDIILSKKQYTESYNASRGGPNWVSWEINATQFGGAPRCDCFSADLTLPDNAYRVVDFDYRNGGYDRGHMVQSESRTTTDQENASTFLLTNILPQGAENNQGPWSKFENYLNDLARGTAADPTKHEIYVIAGGRYGSNPGTLKDEGKVAIPDYTWKIAVVMPEGEGLADVHSTDDLNVIAVEMPNLTTPGVPATSIGIRNNPWEQYKTSVDKIEGETGYDFLAKLPDRVELLVESGDNPPSAAWTGETSGAEGSAVTFDASGSTDADNDALTYGWDFGDGTTSSAANVSHKYADNGDYIATLTVKDPTGADDTETRTIHISNVAPVVGSVSATGTVYSGESVFATGTFSDAGTVDSPWKYTFDWGAGSTSEGFTNDQASQVGSSRSFLEAGTYSVSFSVTDKDHATSAARTATFRVLGLPTALIVNPQRINLQGSGDNQVIATILGTQSIAAASIDLGSIRIGNIGADLTGSDGFKAAQQDVDGDGIADLVVHFRRNALMSDGQLTSRTTQLLLRANLGDGRQLEARGPVTVGAKE